MNIIERLRRWWALRRIIRQGLDKVYYVFPLLESEEFWKTSEEMTFDISFDLTAIAEEAEKT